MDKKKGNKGQMKKGQDEITRGNEIKRKRRGDKEWKERKNAARKGSETTKTDVKERERATS